MANALSENARQYVQSVLPVLEARLPEFAGGARYLPRWERADEHSFSLRAQELSPLETTLYSALTLPKSAAYEPLYKAISEDPRFEGLLGRLVGTAGAGGTRLDPEGLIRNLVWRVARAANSFAFNEEAFTTGYTEWLAAATAREIEARIVVPLHPLRFEGSIDLDAGFEIGQLTDEDISACLTMGAMHAPLAQTGDAIVTSRVAIIGTRSVPRGPLEGEHDMNDLPENRAIREANEIVDALRLFAAGRVAVRGRVVRYPALGNVWGGPVGPSNAPPGQPMTLTDDDAASFPAWWVAMRRSRSEKPLDAVVRRFSYAGERERRDDEIVDLVAALEALLLSDIDDPREMTYRTALRGATFIDSGLTKRQVQTQLTRAYSVRSAVAHGGAPRKKDLKSHNEEPVSLDAFAEGIEELVRAALVKAVNGVAAGAGWPPDWDGLILEHAHYPPDAAC